MRLKMDSADSVNLEVSAVTKMLCRHMKIWTKQMRLGAQWKSGAIYMLFPGLAFCISGKSMGVKHTVLPDGQHPTVAFIVLAQLCGPKANETEMGGTLVTKNGEGRKVDFFDRCFNYVCCYEVTSLEKHCLRDGSLLAKVQMLSHHLLLALNFNVENNLRHWKDPRQLQIHLRTIQRLTINPFWLWSHVCHQIHEFGRWVLAAAFSQDYRDWSYEAVLAVKWVAH